MNVFHNNMARHMLHAFLELWRFHFRVFIVGEMHVNFRMHINLR